MNTKQIGWIVRVGVSVALVVLLDFTLAPCGLAEERRGRGEEDRRGHEVQRWRHGDIGRFHEGDRDRWRGGRWAHGEHLGRLGWWWIVDGVWYFYPAPVYPYPDPYVPSTVLVQGSPPPPPPQAAPQYWYYCASVREYYPYVSHCPEGWMQVVPQLTPPGR